MTDPRRGNDDGSAASFVRGLTIGALLGAAVAGSSLWSRRRRARKARESATMTDDRAGLITTGQAASATNPDQTGSAPSPED
ncbi:MAG: hypothetical protein ACJ77N_15010 [Chloroflexota bacterium]